MTIGLVIRTTMLLMLFSQTSWANEIYITQSGDRLDLEMQQRSQDNYISFNETGDDNTVKVYQGMQPDGTIDYNTVEHTQRGKAGHDGFVEIQGDSNTVDLYQRGSRAQYWADIVLTGDDHTVDVDQQGTKSASATIDLTNSGGAYDFTLTQNVTTSADSFSITGSCATAGGCSVIVNRNN
jgi:hypothetical protein